VEKAEPLFESREGEKIAIGHHANASYLLREIRGEGTRMTIVAAFATIAVENNSRESGYLKSSRSF